jgi:Skp family chaperone for outer membrane proteins
MSYLKFLAAPLVALSLGAVTIPNAAIAQDQGPKQVRLALIDYEALLRKCKACVHATQQIEAKRQEFQKAAEASRKGLDTKQKELERQKTVLAPDAFQKRVADLRNEAQAVLKQERQWGDQIAKAQQQALGAINQKIREAASKVAVSGKFNLIFRRDVVFLSDEDLDITPLVLAEVDKTFPSLPINFK